MSPLQLPVQEVVGLWSVWDFVHVVLGPSLQHQPSHDFDQMRTQLVLTHGFMYFHLFKEDLRLELSVPR